jgi:class 3 adenylate cyclase
LGDAAGSGLTRFRREPDDAGQRRQVTVMFCDLVGSTELADRLDPEDYGELLSAYHDLCARAIERYQGHTAQLLGDGVLAYFGYPEAHEDDAQRAAHAGLTILERLPEAGGVLDDVPLRVRIALHTGVVVAGSLSAGDRHDEQLVVGDAPALAARLQALAPPGSIVVSSATLELIGGYFVTEPLGEHPLRGFSRPIAVHRVLGSSGAIDRLDAAAGPLAPLVGRERELERLLDAWGAACEGRGALIHVVGEPGIGKSRLLRELAQRAGERGGTVQRWQCSRHHSSSVLRPVIALLERDWGIDAGQRDEVRLAAVRASLDGSAHDERTLSLLAELLGIGVPVAAREPERYAREVRAATLELLERLLVRDPGRHPLLLVVDDLQWADPTTLELLGRIARAAERLPLLCAIAFRAGFEPPWRRAPTARLALGPLAEEHARLLAAAAAGRPLDEDAADSLQTAGGVPLFVEELARMLGAGASPAASTGARELPGTLQGLLAERLDRLPEVGAVLDGAAVLGRDFDGELLDALAGEDAPPPGALAALVEHDVLRPLAGPRPRYEFCHALLHEAAYERILRRRRQALHARAAAVMVERFPALAERDPQFVARHLSLARDPARAVRYWHRAGVRALERAAFAEAAEHFRRGLEELDAAGEASQSQRGELLTLRAAALQAGRGYAAEGVSEAYAAASAIWRARGADERLASVIRGEWMRRLVSAEYGAAAELAEEMLALAERCGEELRAEGHMYGALVEMYRGRLDPAREEFERALATYLRPARADHVYEAQGDTQVGTLAYLAGVLSSLGDTQRARSCSERSLELAEHRGGPVTRAQAWFMRAMLHLSHYELAEFAAWMERTRAYSTDRNVRYWRALATAYATWAQAGREESARGVPRLQEQIDAYTGAGARLGLSHLLVLLGDLQLAAGERSAALEAVGQAEQFVADRGEGFFACEVLRLKARILLAGADEAGARATLEASLALAEEQDNRLGGLRALNQLVAFERAAGAGGAAACERRLAERYDWFEPGLELPDLAHARRLLEER